MGAQQQKPTSVGSAYINVRKGTSDDVQQEVNNAIGILMEHKAYLSISLRKANGEGYIKMTGFFNEYKRAAKDPDIMIRLSEVAPTPQTPRQAEAPKPAGRFQRKAAPAPAAARRPAPAQDNSFDSEEVPFG